MGEKKNWAATRSECDGLSQLSGDEACALVRRACGAQAHTVDYLRLAYCAPGAQKFKLAAISAWLALLLSLLGSTADLFFIEQCAGGVGV